MYTLEENNLVLNVFDQVLISIQSNPAHVIEKNYRLEAARITAEQLMEPASRYSNLDYFAIVRWHMARQKQKSRPGPKIISDFEREVWAGMVISQLFVDAEVTENVVCMLRYLY